MPSPDLSAANWRKSTYSNGDGGDCVEVADSYPAVISVRDSKTPASPVLLINRTAWRDFIAYAGTQAHA